MRGSVTSKYASVSQESPCPLLLKDLPFYRQIRIKACVTDLRDGFLFNSDITNQV
ncbi:MAG: hypothetical protein LUP97_01055 [Methanoregula sp.]|nr:hypothetical protein [Methanoregula sp.]